MKVGKSAIYLTISRLTTTFLALLTAMLLSRFRTLEEYGTYSQIMLISNLITSVVMLGLPNSINYFYNKTDNIEEKDNFVSTFYSFNTILSFIAGLILVLSAPILETYFENPMISSLIFLFSVYPWTKIIINTMENYLIVNNKIKYIIYYKVSHSILLLFTIFISYQLKFNFFSYLLIFISIEIVFTILVYLTAKKINKFKFNIDYELLKKILVYSVPIGLASSIGVLNSEIDKLFVSIAYDTELTAIYTNAAREIPVSIIIASITAVVVPELVKLLSNNQQVKAINLWKASMAIGMYIMFFFGALFFVFSEEIMVFLYSDKYISGSNLFRIYSLNMIIRFTYFGAILSSLGKSKYILFSSLATLVLNIILNFVLHYFLGVNGLAIATLCSLALVALFQLGITSKIMKIKFKQIFPINYFIKIAIINILFALLFWFVKVKTQELLNDILLLLITSCIWFLLYGFIIKKSIKKLWYKIN